MVSIIILLLYSFSISLSAQNDSTTIVEDQLRIYKRPDIQRIPTITNDCPTSTPIFQREDIFYLNLFERIESGSPILIRPNNKMPILFLSNRVFYQKEIVLKINDPCVKKHLPNDQAVPMLLVSQKLSYNDTVEVDNAGFIPLSDFPWDTYLLQKAKNKRSFSLRKRAFILKARFLKNQNKRQYTIFYQKRKLAFYEYQDTKLMHKQLYE